MRLKKIHEIKTIVPPPSMSRTKGDTRLPPIVSSIEQGCRDHPSADAVKSFSTKEDAIIVATDRNCWLAIVELLSDQTDDSIKNHLELCPRQEARHPGDIGVPSIVSSRGWGCQDGQEKHPAATSHARG